MNVNNRKGRLLSCSIGFFGVCMGAAEVIPTAYKLKICGTYLTLVLYRPLSCLFSVYYEFCKCCKAPYNREKYKNNTDDI